MNKSSLIYLSFRHMHTVDSGYSESGYSELSVIVDSELPSSGATLIWRGNFDKVGLL